MVLWEDFDEEESEGLLPVLHLCSDWPGSPQVAPYECKARPLRAWLRHPGYAVHMHLLCDHPVERLEWVSAGLAAGRHDWLHMSSAS